MFTRKSYRMQNRIQRIKCLKEFKLILYLYLNETLTGLNSVVNNNLLYLITLFENF